MWDSHGREEAVSRSIHRAVTSEPYSRGIPNTGLVAVGDLGYSGSVYLSLEVTFFRTANARYLINSLPRSSEHTFFKEELLVPYARYMEDHTDSLLVHITDLLGVASPVLGAVVGYTPSHHVIMENVMGDREKSAEPGLWEAYDMKPIDYFYPERDLMPQPLTTRAVRSRLYGHFNDKVRVTKNQFPSSDSKELSLAMLGLGDIVVPGMMIGLALRFDL